MGVAAEVPMSCGKRGRRMGRAVQEEGITQAKPLSMQDSLHPSAYPWASPIYDEGAVGFLNCG